MTTVDPYSIGMAAGIEPEPELTVSEWADSNRFLSQKASAEHGPWRTSRTPYLREIMDRLSPSDPAKEIVFMKGAQIGGTEAGNNWIGYVIHHAPAPMMVVQPTLDMAKRNSKQRVDPLIQESPVLRKLVQESRSRDSSNTVLAKEFPGGILVMTGANSAKGLRSMAAKYLFLDEIDAYDDEVENEGDPIQIVTARARTFPRRKVFKVSTPKTAGSSKIERAYQDSDARQYWVPCPFCSEFQVLVMANLRWDKNDWKSVHYRCANCAGKILERHKSKMLEDGEWRAQFPEREARGYHLSSLYSPVGWFSWADAAEMWDKAQESLDSLKVFINTVLGETWKQKGETPDWHKLYDRRERYDVGIVPEGGLLLTAAVDVQADRLEFEVKAWGSNGGENWSVYYEVIQPVRMVGDQRIVCNVNDPEPWARLAELIEMEWPHANGGTLPIMATAIDTGYLPQRAYSFCLKYPSPLHGPLGSSVASYRTVFPIKGGHSALKILEGVSDIDAARKRGGLKIWTIGTLAAKDEIYQALRKESPVDGAAFPARFCHHPAYEASYFQGLCAETRVVSGKGTVEWRKDGRNEPLDLHVYNLAAATLCGIWNYKAEAWEELQRRLDESARVAKLPDEEKQKLNDGKNPPDRPIRGRFF